MGEPLRLVTEASPRVRTLPQAPQSPDVDDDLGELFAYWYQDGRRRTHADVASHFGSSIHEVLDKADRFGWVREANRRDAEARSMIEKRSALAIARARAIAIEIIAHQLMGYAPRISPVLENGQPNPDYLPAEAVPLKDWLAPSNSCKNFARECRSRRRG
jgi:hypothetical protein